MEKDCHLIEGALETDGTVISLDEVVRRAFDKAADRVGELRHVAWVNPDHLDEEVLQWLEGGAVPVAKQRLGFRGSAT